MLLNKETGIAVAGTHGKTTTSSMAASAMLPLDPTIVVGGILPEIGSNAKPGKSNFFIAGPPGVPGGRPPRGRVRVVVAVGGAAEPRGRVPDRLRRARDPGRVPGRRVRGRPGARPRPGRARRH